MSLEPFGVGDKDTGKGINADKHEGKNRHSAKKRKEAMSPHALEAYQGRLMTKLLYNHPLIATMIMPGSR